MMGISDFKMITSDGCMGVSFLISTARKLGNNYHKKVRPIDSDECSVLPITGFLLSEIKLPRRYSSLAVTEVIS